MRCPFCAHDDSQVKDRRPTEDNTAIRRRRQCEGCGARFTTFERVQLREIVVVKSGGASANRSTAPRSSSRSPSPAASGRIAQERIDQLVSGIQRQIETHGRKRGRVGTAIGEMVMDGLRQLDSVAYIRFASVYAISPKPRDFEEFASSVSRMRARRNDTRRARSSSSSARSWARTSARRRGRCSISG